MLTSQFRVIEESVGVPFLVGQVVKVIRASGLNPMMPTTYCIVPVKVRETDDRFMKLFKTVKPPVHTMKEGILVCSGGIVAELEETDV